MVPCEAADDAARRGKHLDPAERLWGIDRRDGLQLAAAGLRPCCGQQWNVASQTVGTASAQVETQRYSYDDLNRLRTAVAGGNYVPDQPVAPQVAADSAAQVKAEFAGNR